MTIMKFEKFRNSLTKVILLLTVMFTLFSCKKDEGQCYNCTFGVVNGVQRPPEKWCGDPNHVFQDAEGNNLNSFCQPIP